MTFRYQQAFSDMLPSESEDKNLAVASAACKPVKYDKYAAVIKCLRALLVLLRWHDFKTPLVSVVF